MDLNHELGSAWPRLARWGQRWGQGLGSLGAYDRPVRSYHVAMTPETPRQRPTHWTKDRAGAVAAGFGSAIVGFELLHEQMLSFRYAVTASAIVALVIGNIAFWLMLKVMRRLP